MASDWIDKLRSGVRDVPDFPKKGIVFKDITPILKDGALFRASIDVFLERCRGKKIDKIVGIDARGFLFGSAVAYELGVGFVPIRKRGKLPYKTEIAKYSLEYGEAEMEMHIDAISAGEQIVLVDDLLATGGTSAAAARRKPPDATAMRGLQKQPGSISSIIPIWSTIPSASSNAASRISSCAAACRLPGPTTCSTSQGA